jgi:iron(III) transport system substrate-binding protein
MSQVRLSLVIALSALALIAGCHRRATRPEVIVYVSVDQVHAEPVLREFERQSGISVRAVYDVEASKTTGLANRIAAERSRPQADVFWNGEFVQTLRLKSEGLLAASNPPAAAALPDLMRDPDGQWFANGARFRAILINTGKLGASDRPQRFEDFVSPRWPGNDLAIALPLFGTSAAQAAALYATMGPDKARGLYQQMSRRGVRVADGNSVVRDLVAQGRASAGWTDSDDSCEAIANGAPVEMVFPDQEGDGTLMIPGTVAKVAGAPHSREAEALIDFLLQPTTEKMLIDSGFFQISVRPGGPVHPCIRGITVKTLQIGLPAIAAQLDRSRLDLTAIFNR